MKYIVIIILGIIILGLTHSRLGDIVGIATIAYGFGMAYIREKKTWRGDNK